MLKFTEHSSEYISIGKRNLKIGSFWINTRGRWVPNFDGIHFTLTSDDLRQIAAKLDELNAIR